MLRQCEAFYVGVWERLTKVIAEVYDDGGGSGSGSGLEVDWKREDVVVAFRK